MRGSRLLVCLVLGMAVGCGGGSAGTSKDDVQVDSKDTLVDGSGDVDTDVPAPDTKDTAQPDGLPLDLTDIADVKDVAPDETPDVPDVDLCPDDCDDQDPCTTDVCKPEVGCEHTAVPNCCDAPQPLKVDFETEAALEGWAMSSDMPAYTDKPELPNLTWSRFDGRAHTSTWSLYFGDTLTKTYDNGHRVAAVATSPEFHLAPSARYALRFWVYLGVEEGVYSDYMLVNVVADGVPVRVWAKDATSTVSKWNQIEVDLSAFSGKTIRLQFAFDSHDEHENGLEGIYVDDISVDRNCSADLSCSSAAGCNDFITCTKETCNQGKCQYSVTAGCCLTPAECEDWDGCTLDKCSENKCLKQADPNPKCCNSSDTCHDQDDVCTLDVCKNSKCQFLPSGQPGCCTQDAQCNDNDTCTADRCENKTCVYVPICCTQNSDCNDGDDLCTNDLCEVGKCKYYVSGSQGCCAPQMVTEDFEDGMAQGFLFTATNPTQLQWVVGVGDAYQGNQSMFIDASGITSAQSAEAILPLAQIPPVGGKLTFYMKQTMASSGDCSLNKLVVKFNTAMLQTECNTIADWYKVSVSLSSIAGQQGALSIVFYASPYSSSAYKVWVDKILVEQQCCSDNSQCDDGNACTADSCPGSNSVCQFVPIEGCCLSDSVCEDGDECTDDRCLNNWCEHINECCAMDGVCDAADDICTVDHCLNSRCYFEPTGVAGCCEPDQYLETFEAGFGGWEPTDLTSPSRWRLTTADAVSGSQALYFGNEAGTAYNDNVESAILGPQVTIPSAPGVRLNFQTRYTTEGPDKFKVVFRSEDGVDHMIVELSGTQSAWTLKTYDLQAYAGQKGRFVFNFRSDGSITYLGVFVDDVSLVIDCCSASDQCDDDNPCTLDSCPGSEAMCVNLPVEGCCITNGNCADGDACTLDICTLEHVCTNTDICCESDAECDDGDDVCTQDLCLGNYCFFSPTGTPGCCTPEAFAENFDSGSLASRWTAQNPGTGDEWRLGSAHVVSAPSALYFGSSSENGYSNSIDSSLTLNDPLTVPNAEGVALQFQIWSSTESGFDKLSVFVLEGQVETKLGEVSGEANSFAAKSYPLDAFRGKPIRIRFTFHSDGSSTRQGIWIDNLMVTRECCDTVADCNDDKVCTIDSCPGPVSECIFAPVPGCCETKADCDDGDACTVDSCTESNTCLNLNECCANDQECDDGDDVCTADHCVNSKCKFLPTGVPGCCQSSLFFDDFESGLLTGYVVQNDADSPANWHITTIASVSGSSALIFSANDDLSYGNNVDATLTTPTIDVPLNAISPKLLYSVRYYTESCCDRLTVHVVQGTVETQLAEYKGQSDAWIAATSALDAYKGKTIQIRLKFHSDSGLGYWGAMVDNLQVKQECCTDSAQCNDNDPCTVDYCPGANAGCINEEIPNCCVSGADCLDDDPCTLDKCSEAHNCHHINTCCTDNDQCNDQDSLCTQDSCVNGQCFFAPTGMPGCCATPLFEDTFSTDKGWTYEGQWQRGPAVASTCAESPLKQDPATDYTGSSDNFLAGVAIGECVSETTTGTWYYMTSPVIDTSLAPALYLGFWRHLNSDSFLYADNRVELWDGASWVKVWGQNSQATADANWVYVEYNVTPYKSAESRVRFGVNVLSAAGKAASSWNVDDVRLYVTTENHCCGLDTDCSGFGDACLGGKCVDKCLAGCMGRECGPNPCGGSCGTCPNGGQCQPNGMCCVPQCLGKECGDDGCGGTCGSCGTNESCQSGNYGCNQGSVECGTSCCNAGSVCFDGACCKPMCDGMQCGDDGCGSVCGTCGSLEQCLFGTCECDWEMLPLEGEFFRVSMLEFVDETQPTVGFDVDEDPETCAPASTCVDGIDNAFAGFIESSPQADLNLLMIELLEAGYLVPLFQFQLGQELPLSASATLMGGLQVGTADSCNFLVDSECEHKVLGESFEPGTCSMEPTWAQLEMTTPMSFVGGDLDSVLRLAMRLPQGKRAMLTIYAAHVDAGWVVDSGTGHVEGVLGGAVLKQDFLDLVDQLPLLPGMTPSVVLFKTLLDVFLVPDIDLDGDGEFEACSLALRFMAIPTTITGVEAP